MKRWIALLLLFSLLLYGMPASAESAGTMTVTPQDAVNSVCSTDMLLQEFFRQLVSGGGADIALTDADGILQAETDFSLRDGYAYLAGRILPDLLHVPLESIGLDAGGLYLKKDGQTGYVPFEAIVSALSAAYLGVDLTGPDIKRDAGLLTAMAQETGMQLLAWAMTCCRTESDGTTVITVRIRDLRDRLLTTVAGVLNDHQADADALLDRWRTAGSLFFPELREITVSRLTAALYGEAEKETDLPFESVTLSISADTGTFALYTDQDLFRADLRTGGGKIGLSVLLRGTAVLTIDAKLTRNDLSISGSCAGHTFSADCTRSNDDRLHLSLTADGLSLLELNGDPSGSVRFTSALAGSAEGGWTVGTGRSAPVRFYLSIAGRPVFDCTVSSGDRWLTVRGSLLSVGFGFTLDPDARHASFDLTEPDIRIDLSWSADSFDLTGFVSGDRFEARGVFRSTDAEFSVTFNGTVLFRAGFGPSDSGTGHRFFMNAPGVNLTGELRLPKDGPEITAQFNGTPVTLSVKETERGFVLNASAGSEHFYAALTEDRYGLWEFFHSRRGGFNLTLCHNAYTVTVTGSKGQLEIHTDGDRGSHLEADISLITGEGRFLLQKPDRSLPGAQYWHETEIVLKDRRFSYDLRSAGTNGRRTDSMTLFHFEAADLTAVPDYMQPVIAEHYNITSLSWSGRYTEPGGLLLTTDRTGRDTLKTSVVRQEPDGTQEPVCVIDVSYSRSRTPFDRENAEVWSAGKLLTLLEQ